MDKITSKDIIIIIILGIIITTILAFVLRIRGFNFSELKIENFIIILPVVVAIVIIIYMKLNEINKELDNQKINQQKIDEKLKIHEQLININSKLLFLENENREIKKNIKEIKKVNKK